MMAAAASWKQAKEIAAQQNLEIVYHDFETGQYGAASKSDLPGHFKCGAWIPHRIFSVPATTSPEEIDAQEKAFIAAHPECAAAPEAPAAARPIEPTPRQPGETAS